MINVGELVTDPDFVQPVVVTRKNRELAKEGLRAGEVLTAETTRTEMVCIQPSQPEDLLLLGEGYRTSRVIVIYTAEKVFCEDGDYNQGDTLSDSIPYHNDMYIIKVVEDWSAYGYWKAIAISSNHLQGAAYDR